MGKVYVIKKGDHYSNHTPKLCYGKTRMSVLFKFMDGCWFPMEIPPDSAINKLCGWSWGLHHRNSVRCGWTPSKEPGHIDLFFYVYAGGIRIDRYFTTIELGLEYLLEIDVESNLLSFRLERDGISTTNSLYFPIPKMKLGYCLFPYVGGYLPARVNTKIYIDFKP